MSTATRTAIITALVEDATLAALLATDPADEDFPAIFEGTKNQAPPVYPCITYRVQTDTPDSRFRPVAQEASARIRDHTYAFEAWSQSPDSAEIESILASLTRLLDGNTFTTTGGGRIFRSEEMTSQPDLYDDKLNAWFGLAMYRVRVQL